MENISIKDIDKESKYIPYIIIPYREQVEQKRSQQLDLFCKHMKRWHPEWFLLIIEQGDTKKFNRGALLNIGTKYAQKLGAQYVIYHDVDLIPLAPIVPYYTMFPEKPIHIGGIYKEKYSGSGFLGQVLSISLKDIKKSNGFPNMCWGWGGEDDALRNRFKKNKITFLRPTEEKGYKVLEHIDTRKIPDMKNMRKWEDVREDTGKHGFGDVKWKLVSEEKDHNIIKYTVEIK